MNERKRKEGKYLSNRFVWTEKNKKEKEKECEKGKKEEKRKRKEEGKKVDIKTK